MTSKPDPETSVYIVAHADDWQLFMQPNAYKDLVNPAKKTVFIITTAGDAGVSFDYSLAREEGMKSSIRYCLAPTQPLNESSGTTFVNDHPIATWATNNVACYFLRLPDGGLDGQGFSNNRFESLRKLRIGKISNMTAADESTVYTSWKDVSYTIGKIIEVSLKGARNATLHYQDPDETRNPNDHPDHIATGNAVLQMGSVGQYRQLLYTGYHSFDNAPPLDGDDIFWKAGMFAVYEKAVYDSFKYSTLGENIEIYQRWCVSGSVVSEIPKRSIQPVKS